jgi:Uma2 family endonuclease
MKQGRSWLEEVEGMTVATEGFRWVNDQGRMTFQEFLECDDRAEVRYELVNGELVAMSPPTWLHLRIARYLEGVFNREIDRLGLGWEAFQELGQQTDERSARRPDVAIVLSDLVDGELEQSAVLVGAALLVVEIVSESTATVDYREKVREYEAIGIPEYWIVDSDPFGAAKYVGSPKRPTVSVYRSVNGTYEVIRYQGDDAIVSPTFPGLSLTVMQVLRAGR